MEYGQAGPHAVKELFDDWKLIEDRISSVRLLQPSPVLGACGQQCLKSSLLLIMCTLQFALHNAQQDKQDGQ